MKIVALVKYTPDSTADRSFEPDNTVDRESVPGLLSELDEYTVEQALEVAESTGGEVTYLSMGPDGAVDALRKALSMGGDAAVHVNDDRLSGSDAVATSAVLAAAIRELGFDLVLTGMASTDAGMGVIGSMVAEHLNIPQISFAGSLSVDGDQVRIERETDEAGYSVAGTLPALVSVTDRTGEARYPSFKGIMAAKKKVIRTLNLDDIGVDPNEVGTAGEWSSVVSVRRRPERQAGEIVTDDGDGGRRVADFLARHQFA